MPSPRALLLLLLAAAAGTALPSPLPIVLPGTIISSLLPAPGDFPGDTQNGLLGGGAAAAPPPCRAMTIIFARGSGETGNVGTATGPPFFRAVAARIGASNLAVQGVEYAAAFLTVLSGGDQAGSARMAELAQLAVSRCPDTTVVLAGYSQGGQLVHNAAALLPPETADKIAAAVAFGDPDNGEAFANIPDGAGKTYCHPWDNICQHGVLITPFHYSYATQYVPAAADFVVSKMPGK